VIRLALFIALFPCVALAQTRSTVEITYGTADAETITPGSIGEFYVDTDDTSSPVYASTIAAIGGMAPIRLTGASAFAHMTISSNAASSSAITVDVFSLLDDGTCELHGDTRLFTESANCVLRYDGSEPRDFQVTVSFSVTKGAGATTTFYFRLAKNADPYADLSFRQQIIREIPLTDVGAASISGHFPMVTNDTIGLYGSNDDTGNDVTVNAMSLIISEL
jgi:hypothetical protein